MKNYALALIVLLLPFNVTAQSTVESTEQSELTAEQQKYVEWARSFLQELDFKSGKIELPGDMATLNVPESFYYLSPEDAERVLTEAWGNPPGGKTLGMLFPANTTPFDPDAWGVTIEYAREGYVADDDADKINYNEMLQEMKKATAEASAQRQQQGFEPIELIGWAAQPYYDKSSHKLHWAKEIKFGDSPQNTLNYNIRVLGREGYLLLNFIAGMAQLPEIEEKVDSVPAMAEFKPGYRYDEFNPDTDKTATYGLAALVAGTGAVVLAKKGFFAVALVFLKKFGVLIAIGAFFLFRSVFRRKKNAKA